MPLPTKQAVQADHSAFFGASAAGHSPCMHSGCNCWSIPQCSDSFSAPELSPGNKPMPIELLHGQCTQVLWAQGPQIILTWTTSNESPCISRDMSVNLMPLLEWPCQCNKQAALPRPRKVMLIGHFANDDVKPTPEGVPQSAGRQIWRHSRDSSRQTEAVCHLQMSAVQSLDKRGDALGSNDELLASCAGLC